MSRAYTAVQARRGTRVHATSIGAEHAGRTLCGVACDGWSVAVERLSCPRCAAKIVTAARGDR